MLTTAESLSERTSELSGAERVRQMHSIALGRLPNDEEIELAMDFVDSDSWEQYAQILLMTNELMFVE